MPQKIAVIGLGSMGFGIAQSVLAAGHQTFGYDVVAAQEQRFRALGGAEGDLDAVAPGLDAVAVVVLNAAQTEAVLFGDNAIVLEARDHQSLLFHSNYHTNTPPSSGSTYT